MCLPKQSTFMKHFSNCKWDHINFMKKISITFFAFAFFHCRALWTKDLDIDLYPHTICKATLLWKILFEKKMRLNLYHVLGSINLVIWLFYKFLWSFSIKKQEDPPKGPHPMNNLSNSDLKYKINIDWIFVFKWNGCSALKMGNNKRL